MRTKVLVLLAVLFGIVSANAQRMVGKPEFAIMGGEQGKNYAVMINDTKLSKKDFIDGVTKFLSSLMMIDSNDVHLDQISEDMAEYKVSMRFRQCIKACKGLMGARYTDCPVKILGQLRFEFYDNDTVMLVFENFSDSILAVKPDFTGEWTGASEEYLKEANLAITMTTGFGRYMVGRSAGWDEKKMEALQNKITEYFNNIDARYMVYDKMVKEGSAQWMTPAQYPQWLKGVNNPGVNAQLPYIQKFVDEGRMLAVSQQRWTEDIVPLCDDIFIAISKKLKGNIVGVAEDGIQTWELDENGNLLPVDPKLKKKYVKKGLNYYNQE